MSTSAKMIFRAISFFALLAVASVSAQAEPVPESQKAGTEKLRLDIAAEVFVVHADRYMMTREVERVARTGAAFRIPDGIDFWYIKPARHVEPRLVVQQMDKLDIPGIQLPESAGDQYLAEICRAKRIKYLFLADSMVTDAGLLPLGRHEALSFLDLSNDLISGEGLRYIPGLNVDGLSLGKRISDADMKIVAVHFKNLRRLSLISTELTEDGLKLVGQMQNLEELMLPFESMGGGELAQLRGLKRLRVLSVSQVLAEGDELKHLAALPELEELHLSGNISEDGLQALKPNGRLRVLSLMSTRPFNDVSLATVALHKELQDLQILTGEFSVQGLKHLSTLPKLKILKISNMNLREGDIAAGNELAELEVLWMYGGSLGDSGLEFLGDGGKLRELSLGGTSVSDAGLEEIAKFEKLQVLFLYCNMDDEGMRHLQNLKALRELSLPENITHEGLAHLSRLPNIEKFQWMGSGNHGTDEAIAYIASWKKLKRLVVRNSIITDQGAAVIGTLPELEVLDVSGSIITNRGLAEIGKLKKLQHLNVEATRVDGEGLKSLAGLQELSFLNLSKLDIKSDDVKLLQELPWLKTLLLTRTKIDDAAVDNLAAIKGLGSLLVGRTEITEDGNKRLKYLLPHTTVLP